METVIRFIPFVASSGREYELKLRFDSERWPVISQITRFVEDERGTVTAEPLGSSWYSISEMTHELAIEIAAWGSDTGN